MHIIDMERRLDYLTERYLEATNPDELDRLHEQMQHYRKEIKAALIEHLGSLEYEARRELDGDRDNTMDAIDAVRRRLAGMKDEHTCIGMVEPPLDEDGLIDGKESRGLVCSKCGQIGCDCG